MTPVLLLVQCAPAEARLAQSSQEKPCDLNMLSNTAACLLLVAFCLQACCHLCDARAADTSPPPSARGACHCHPLEFKH